MKLLRVMGCDSVQYGSMERYLVRLTAAAARRGHRSVIAYNSTPQVAEFVEDIRRAGGELVSLDLPARSSWHLAAARAGRLVRRERPDVLHGYFTPLCHEMMALGAALRIDRRYRTCANMPWSARPGVAPGSEPTAAFCLKQRLLSRLPRRIVALSSVMKGELRRLGVPDERIVVIHGGVDSAYFSPANTAGRARIRAEWGVGEDEQLVGYLGRLVPVKALDVLLDAAARVNRDHPAARFVLVGGGPLRSVLEERARSLGLNGRCFFAGHRTDARDVLAALDLVAHPSLSEGMSNSLLEAMAMSRPVVASAIPPNAEVVVDGETGLLVPPGDASSFAAALSRLLDDGPAGAAMGRRGRERVERRFTLDRRVQAELDLYEGP